MGAGRRRTLIVRSGAGPVVVNEFSLSGNAASTQAADGADVSGGDTAGQLLAGNLEVYVDNTAGNLTAEELDRINDAIDTVNLVTSSYGVAVTEVSDPTTITTTTAG